LAVVGFFVLGEAQLAEEARRTCIEASRRRYRFGTVI
jgi:hypothetical protein